MSTLLVSPVVLKPVPETDRLYNLDVLRGVALLGILLMNIPFYSMPEYYRDVFRADPGSIDFWFDAVLTVLFEGKMRALFSMIFGVGILLFIVKKEKSWSVTWLFYRRMFWLLLLGLADAHLLLWVGDILYLYGVCGLLAYLFRKMQARYLALGVPIVAILGFVASVSFYQGLRQQRIAYVDAKSAQDQRKTLTDTQTKALAEWKEVEKEFIPDKQMVAEHTAAMKSDYSGVAGFLRPMAWNFQTKYLIYQLGDAIALMLLGMALYKWGFLTGKWTTRQYVVAMLIGYGVGLPLVIYNYYYSFLHFSTLDMRMLHMKNTPMPWIDLIYPFQRIFLVIAHASALLLLVRMGVLAGLMARLAAVGRMALTNYVMHSVFCTLIFYGYGLNYFAELRFYQLYYVVAGIWLFQLWLSPIWLKYYLFGPLEWFWRSLTYWKTQPMKRTDAVTQSVV